MLEINELSYSVGEFNLEINRFIVKNKSIHTLLGNSGAGKSTLLNLIAGHLKPKTGTILLNDYSILNLRPNKRKIALVFQNSLLFPNMTVYHNIGYALRVKKIGLQEIEGKVTLWLKRMNLIGYENRMPNDLSGGEKKRVAIARALITEPALVLMDEPLNGLDPKLRNEMLNLIKKIQKETCTAILYITHDFEEALKISDRISVIKDGQMIHTGTPESLLFEPADSSIVDFFNYYNQKNISIQENEFYLYNQKITSEKKGHYSCIVPPQGIVLTSGNGAHIMEKHLLKYGNIYLIKNDSESFYAFSRENFNVGSQVSYSVQSQFIQFKKES
jgi:spermidine/putrescine transport system ATP-binding protein